MDQVILVNPWRSGQTWSNVFKTCQETNLLVGANAKYGVPVRTNPTQVEREGFILSLSP
jgi:hypothetical protein